MADKEKPAANASRKRHNSVAVDDKDRAVKAGPSAAPDKTAQPSASPLPGQEKDKRMKSAKPQSVEAGDLPEAVRKRYYADRSRWSGEPAYFTTAETKDPAFRDQGRRLTTATESQEVVKDLVAIAAHRGWDRIHVTGTEAFRRSVWLEAAQRGLEVRGYKPNERDLEALDRARSNAARNTIAPMAARAPSETGTSPRSRPAQDEPWSGREAEGRGREPARANARAADSQMRVVEAVIRRTLFDQPEAVARVMKVARDQFDKHIAAGRTIQPAVVRAAGPAAQRVAERPGDPVRSAAARPGRDHKPPERHRSR